MMDQFCVQEKAEVGKKEEGDDILLKSTLMYWRGALGEVWAIERKQNFKVQTLVFLK